MIQQLCHRIYQQVKTEARIPRDAQHFFSSQQATRKHHADQIFVN